MHMLQMNTTNCCTVDTCKCSWFLYFTVVPAVSTASSKHLGASIIYGSLYNTDDLPNYRSLIYRSMRHDILGVILTLTTDTVLISVVGFGNVACVRLEIIVMNTTAINWVTMTLFTLVLY